jgi:hypothetical protein
VYSSSSSPSLFSFSKSLKGVYYLNATNIYIMNAKCERGSNLENFGARITEFGVVAEKI